jgi:SAM-dependent methyltransferase
MGNSGLPYTARPLALFNAIYPMNAMSLDEETFRRLIDRMSGLETEYAMLPRLSDSQFEQFAETLHRLQAALKQNLYVADYRNQTDAEKFEFAFGAQSTQFIIDLLPYLHEVMREHYSRSDELKLVDIGAGSCIGTNLLAQLHSDHIIYSRLQIDAVDYTDVRRRWIRALYPKIRHRVADVFDLPDRTWDFVVCSHVIEHLEQPRVFIEQLRRICRGFAFVYSPYEEFERIPYHLSTITRETYAGIPSCRLEVLRSMGWRGDIPGNHCLLAVIDCRAPLESTA